MITSKLKKKYFQQGDQNFPSATSKNFSLVDTWSTDLRYKAGTLKRADAESFLQAAREIIV